MASGGSPPGSGRRAPPQEPEVAAARLATLAGVSARLASVAGRDIEQVLVEVFDDLLFEVDADRWTFVFHPGLDALGGPLTPFALHAIEEALRARIPVTVEAPPPVAEGDAHSALAVTTSAAGVPLGVLVLERLHGQPWATDLLGFTRAVADILGGTLARRLAEEEARRADDGYQRLLETSAEAVCLLRADGTIQFANRAFAQLVGETRASLARVPVTRYLVPEERSTVVARLLHESARFDVEIVRRDGGRRWVSCSTSSLREDTVDGSLALVMMTDVSMRRAAEAALRTSEARFRALVRSSSDIIIVTDADGRISYASPSILDVLGHDPARLRGTSPLDLVHPEDLDRIGDEIRALWDARSGSKVIRCRVATADGRHRQIEAALTNLIDDSAVAGVTITARDITDQVQLQANLTHAAMHDTVTGLPNRRYFNERLTDVLRSRKPAAAVLFADLDGFKAVNDVFGHEAGDDLLRVIGERLVEAVRSGDVVVRHGGDEFAILCPGVDAAEAETIAERIAASVNRPVVVEGEVVAVGVSIGIALSTTEVRTSPRKLVAAADAAMYVAKDGPAKWVFADA